jgi:hypothetical protein
LVDVLGAKRLGLLREIVPATTLIAILLNPSWPTFETQFAVDLNLEISGFENELVDVNGIEVFQITTLFHPLFKCFSRQEPTMR